VLCINWQPNVTLSLKFKRYQFCYFITETFDYVDIILQAFGPKALVLFAYITWLIRRSNIRKAVLVTQEIYRWFGPRAEVEAAEIRKSRPTSKTEPLFIGSSYYNTIITESELTVSQNKRCSHFWKVKWKFVSRHCNIL